MKLDDIPLINGLCCILSIFPISYCEQDVSGHHFLSPVLSAWADKTVFTLSNTRKTSSKNKVGRNRVFIRTRGILTFSVYTEDKNIVGD